MTQPDNLFILPGIEHTHIAKFLRAIANDNLHFTNGTYAYPAKICVPTSLAGFQYIKEQHPSGENTIVIAINSHESMLNILREKNVSETQFEALESEIERAEKIGIPLALQNPDTPVIIIYYDDPTPTPLYNFLAKQGFEMSSLHKWGYGLDPDGPKIEGAHNFDNVYAFPTPNEAPPVCHDITDKEDQSLVVKVRNLMEEIGYHGKPYLSTDNKVMFPTPAEISQYGIPQGNPQNPALG